MPSLQNVRAANAAHPQISPTAVFVGATSGIGLGAIEALLRYSSTPQIIIIGRSQSKFSTTLERLRNNNSRATITFIEAQVALLKDIDRVCALITSQYKSIDLLWLSQGGLANAKGALSPEGLDDDLAISFYSRILFMQRMIPVLNRSSKDTRIVSVLSAGQEGNLITSDLGLASTKDLGVFPLMKHEVTMTSLAMHQLAEQYSNISFVHTNPGMVSTKVHDEWIDGWTGIWFVVGWILRRTMVPFMHWLGYSPEEAGEVGFFEFTDATFVARKGQNFWRLGEKADELKQSALLQKYEGDGWGSRVLEHAMSTCEKVLNQ